MSIIHRVQPADEGGTIKESAPAPSPSPFEVKRAEFSERMSKANAQARETAAIVKRNLDLLMDRVELAYEESHLGHLGLCTVHLKEAKQHLDDALKELPSLD